MEQLMQSVSSQELTPDTSPGASAVRRAYLDIVEFSEALPEKTGRNGEKHKVFTFDEAVGLQVLQREHKACAQLYLCATDGDLLPFLL